jgi:3-phosphoshikimate 1-carboxyvinyltransferase
MRALISRSSISGKAAAPPSKSYTLRGLACSALATGKSEILHPLSSDDTGAACAVLQQIGVGIEENNGSWMIKGGSFHQPGADLFCGESAGTLRFMTAICSLVPGTCRLTAAPSLARRPILPLIGALNRMGIKCSASGGSTPVTVEGMKVRGGTVDLPGDISSQYVTALLFIAPLTADGLTIRLTSPLESKPYVMMTLDCMKDFGVKVQHSPDLSSFTVKPQPYHAAKYTVEGDWSSASYLLALGAAAGKTEVTNLAAKSRQADRDIWILLNRMGADILAGQDSITVKQSNLKAFRADLSDCIDLLPTVSVMAALADGVSELSGVKRARLKESDRIAAVKAGMERMGIEVHEEEDRMLITGTRPRGTVIDSAGDHRIAMAFSILGVVAGDTVIEGAECVSKTFPGYWDVLRSLGAGVEING